MNLSHKLRQLAWGAAILVATTFGAASAFAQGGEGTGTAFTPQSGFFLESQGDSMLLVVMGYDEAHQPVWYTARGAMTTPKLFQGQLIESYGGQTMGGEYQQPNAAVGRGNITVQFADDRQGAITLPSGRQPPIVSYTF